MAIPCESRLAMNTDKTTVSVNIKLKEYQDCLRFSSRIVRSGRVKY